MSSGSSWIAEKIASHDRVDSAAVDDCGIVVVERIPTGRASIAVIGSMLVDKTDVEASIESASGSSLDFIVHLKPQTRVTGAALDRAGPIPIGSVGDLLRALALDGPVSAYAYRELDFIDRGLRQSGAVEHCEILDRRRYRLHRRKGPPVDVFASSEYEVTAAHVRDLVDRYPAFGVLALANPNAQLPSTQASGVAAQNEIEIVFWHELFKKLHSEWM